MERDFKPRWHSEGQSRAFQRRRYGRDRGGDGHTWRERGGHRSQYTYYSEDLRESGGNYGGSRESGGNYGGSRESGGNYGGSREKGSRGKHPAGLRGRDIGMWYAKRSSGGVHKVPSLSMNEDEAHAINDAIDGLASPARPSSSDWHSTTTSSHSATRAPEIGTVATADAVTLKREPTEEDDSFDNPEMFIARNIKEEPSGGRISHVLDRIEDSDFKSAYRANIEGNKLRDRRGPASRLEESVASRLTRNPKLDDVFHEELLQKESNTTYQRMKAARQRLPSYRMRDEILRLVEENQVVVLSGETGCGKTTQVAQFILDDSILRREGSTCRVVCTQPRRISAISVAERVAEERGEALGTSVGYQIRLEAKMPRATGSVLYCTTGIVLKWLQSDPLLASVSHLVLDEIHERDSISDFLICIARDLVPLRPDLKVILMSATLNAEHFSKYYNGCPMVHIPGFTFPVKEYYLEDVLKFTGFTFQDQKQRQIPPWKRYKADPESPEEDEFESYILPHLRQLESTGEYSSSLLQELRKKSSEVLCLELVLALLKHIERGAPGAVLVFLPGWDQISKLHKMIQQDLFFDSRFLVIPLHSLMPTVNQREVFNRPPKGVRKVVIATNIAETSITIEDIVYVVDGGRIKMKNYDRATNITTLLPEWVTMANAKQRRGRAGRVQDGVCFHLYTKAREMLLQQFPMPEIQRTRLEEVILQVKALRLGSCKPFLSKVLDPPEESVIDASIKMLLAINALDEEENLTPLGFHLARLPMDPLTGKMVLMAAIFSCVSPVLTVAASLSFKDPFVMVLGKEKLVDKCRRGHAGDTRSDHVMLAEVFSQWKQLRGKDASSFVWDNFLSPSVLNQLENMRQQFMGMLMDAKFADTRNPDAPQLNRNSANPRIVKAVITAGLYPNVARILKKGGGRMRGQFKGLTLPDVRKASFHPKSVNEQERSFDNSWVVYWEKIKTAKVYLFDTTMISNYPLLLFGQKLEYDAATKVIRVDEFVKIRSDQKVADVIQKLRRELDELLEHKISHPGTTDWSQGSKEGRLLALIVDILSNEKDTEAEVSNRYYGGDADDDGGVD